MRDRSRLTNLIAIGALLAAMAVLGVVAGKPIIELVSDPVRFRAWVDSHGWVSRLAFVGMMIFQLIVAVIPGGPLEGAAGYAFGWVEGSMLCLAGTLIGSYMVYVLVRRFGTPLVETFFSREDLGRLGFLKDAKRLNVLIFLLFFIPGTPKDLLTYVAPLTPARMWTYLLISNLARLPAIVISALGGFKLSEGHTAQAIWAFGIMGVITLLGILYYRRLSARG